MWIYDIFLLAAVALLTLVNYKKSKIDAKLIAELHQYKIEVANNTVKYGRLIELLEEWIVEGPGGVTGQ